MKTTPTRPSLVMLSGHLCSEKMWENQLKAFGASYDCIPYVFRTGDSIEDFAQQVLDTAPVHFSLVGLSMGGYVALEMLRTATHRVDRLALLDTSAEADTPARTAQRYVDMHLADEIGLEAFSKTLPERWMHPQQAAQDSFRQAVTEMVLNVGAAAQKQQQHALMHRADSTSLLASIKCPTLILCGREDQATPLAMHEYMAQHIPDSNLVVVENCGHISTLEQPEIVNAAMQAWLDR